MRFPLMTLARRELRLNPYAMLGPVLVTATAAVFVHAAVVFTLMAVGPAGQAWRAAYSARSGEAATLADDLVASAVILVDIAIATAIVLGSVGAGVVRAMAGTIVRWRLAGATPAQCGSVVAGQVLVASLVGGAFSVLASLPLLATLMNPIFRMVDAGDVSPEVSAASAAITVAAVAGVSMFGTLRPVWTIGRIRPGLALRGAGMEPRRPGRVRALVAVGLTVGAAWSIASVMQASPRADFDSALNGIMGALALLVCALAAGTPWIVPALARIVALAPAAASPACFVAQRQIAAYPRRTSSATLPVLVAAGMASMFFGIIATWQQALRDSGSSEELNTADLFVFLTPPVVIGIVGAGCQMLLAHNRWVSDFSKLRVAGMPRRTVLGTAVSEAALESGVVALLSVGVAHMAGVMTARALTGLGLPAHPVIAWHLIGAIVAAGMAVVVAVNLPAAVTAGRGNPREKLARV